MGLDEQMAEMMRKINRAVPDTKSKEKITNIGATIFDQNLTQETKSKHYNDALMHNKKKNKIRKTKHLADSIKIVNGDIDGIKNGVTTVAFENSKASGVDHGRIARFLNDGTTKMKGDHFVDKARDESKDEVFQAMANKYQEDLKHG